MATFCCTASSIGLSFIYFLLLNPCCLTIDPPGSCVFYVTLYIWLCWGSDSEKEYKMGGLKTPVIPHFVVFSAPSPGNRLGGKACLSLWNFIIFNYLDHDGCLSPSLPVPPFHLVTQTQASHVRLSVCQCFLPFPGLPHPCLSRQLTFFF